VIEDAKTDTGNRTVRIPDFLAPYLGVFAAKIGPQARLVMGGRLDCKKSRVDWVSRELATLCKSAGVPVITPHGLRGSWASFAVQANVASDQVAAFLGHTSFEGMTAKHYVDPAALAGTEMDRVLAAVTSRQSTVTGDPADTGTPRNN
jgi:integrase